MNENKMEQNCDNKEQYLNVLLGQVRCKKVHFYIKEEISSHIEEQIEANLLNGMTKEEAEKAAIADMGNPIETGVALDSIHKPRMEWRMVVLMAMVALLGMGIHQGIVEKLLVNPSFTDTQTAMLNGSGNFAGYTMIGFILMLLVYHIDYTTIGRYAKVLAITFLCSLLLAIAFGQYVNGRVMWLTGFGSMNVSVYSFVMLYVPLYGAVLYKYFGMAYKGLIMALLWGIAPVYIIFRMRYVFWAGMMAIMLAMVLTMAICLNWFVVDRKKVLLVLWGLVAGLPLLGIVFVYKMNLLPLYQMHRIEAFLTNSGDANYLTGLLRNHLSNSRLLGASGMEVVGRLPNYNDSWILTYLSSMYGVLVMVVICCVVAALIIKVFSIALGQKNQLGMVMGCGCGIVFLVQTVLNLLENMGLFPATHTFLPFISAGGSDLIVCYILMAIVLSVYRYKSIYPKHINTKGKAVNIRISL